MSQTIYRGNLASATWPLVSALFGRTVIVGGPDQNFVRQLYSPEDPDKDIGVPQIYYLHNVMPSPTGFASIGYELQSSNSSGLTNIHDIHAIQGTDGAKAYICMSDQGIGVFQIPTRVFVLLLPLAAPYTSSIITTATVHGKTYFYVSNLACYLYEPTTGVLTVVALGGLVAANIVGITAANGYMIAFTLTTVVWSSLITETDFVPSLSTGAGGGSVEGLKGNIKLVVETPNGLMVCSDSNSIAGLFTGNPRFPYQFTEVQGSGGLSSQELIAYDTNSGSTFAYTSNGLQLLGSKRSDLIFPNITDFLAGQIFEDFDESTQTFSVLELSNAMLKKLTLISSRYLVISYGVTALTHALVYDLAQKRWGKLKYTHTDCFEYQLLDQAVSDIPKKSIALVTTDGIVKTVNMDQESTDRVGVAVFGKFQYVRERWLQVNSIVLESIKNNFACNLYLWSSLNGKDLGTPVQITGAAVISGERIRTWNVRKNGVNHSFALIGAFSLSTLIVNFTPTSLR